MVSIITSKGKLEDYVNGTVHLFAAKKGTVESPVTSFVRFVRLLLTKEMLQLMPFFCYIGFQFTLWTGVYGPSLTFARSFPSDPDDEGSNELTSLHGICVHSGMVASATFFALAGRRLMARVGRFPFVLFALVCQFTAFVLILLNIPARAPMEITYDDALLIVPSR